MCISKVTCKNIKKTKKKKIQNELNNTGSDLTPFQFRPIFDWFQLFR